MSASTARNRSLFDLGPQRVDRVDERDAGPNERRQLAGEVHDLRALDLLLRDLHLSKLGLLLDVESVEPLVREQEPGVVG